MALGTPDLYINKIEFTREDGRDEVSYEAVAPLYVRGGRAVTPVELCRMCALRLHISPAARVALMFLLEQKDLCGSDEVDYSMIGRAVGVTRHSAKRVVSELRLEGLITTYRVGKCNPTVKFSASRFIEWAASELEKSRGAPTPPPVSQPVSPAPSAAAAPAVADGASTTTSTNTAVTPFATVVTTVVTTVIPNKAAASHAAASTPETGEPRQEGASAQTDTPAPAAAPAPAVDGGASRFDPSEFNYNYAVKRSNRRPSKRKSLAARRRAEDEEDAAWAAAREAEPECDETSDSCPPAVNDEPAPAHVPEQAPEQAPEHESNPGPSAAAGDKLKQLEDICRKIVDLLPSVPNQLAIEHLREAMETSVDMVGEGDVEGGVEFAAETLAHIERALGPDARYPGAYVDNYGLLAFDVHSGHPTPPWYLSPFLDEDVDPSNEIADSVSDDGGDDGDEFNFSFGGGTNDKTISAGLRFNADV